MYQLDKNTYLTLAKNSTDDTGKWYKITLQPDDYTIFSCEEIDPNCFEWNGRKVYIERS